MCLSVVHKRPKYPSSGKGWKWFSVLSNKQLESVATENSFSYSKWFTAKSYDNSHYGAGFHIFPTKKAAKDHWLARMHRSFVLHEVEYDDLVVTGNERVLELNKPVRVVHVIVARRMRILPNKGFKNCSKKSVEICDYL